MANVIQHPKKRALLASYERCASITQAAKRAKVDRCTHYTWLLEDPEYAKAFEESKSRAGDALEDEAARRAFAGSDTLLIFLLKGRKPETYRERQSLEVTGKDGTPLVDIAAIDAIIARATSSD